LWKNKQIYKLATTAQHIMLKASKLLKQALLI